MGARRECERRNGGLLTWVHIHTSCFFIMIDVRVPDPCTTCPLLLPTLLGFHHNRHACPLVTFTSLGKLMGGHFKQHLNVLRPYSKPWWFSVVFFFLFFFLKKKTASGMGTSCSRGLTSVRLLQQMHVGLREAYTHNCLFCVPISYGLFWLPMFRLCLLRICIYFSPGTWLWCLPYQSGSPSQCSVQTCWKGTWQMLA